MMLRRSVQFGLAALVLGLAPSAVAQFDPQHNHLKCYRIKGKPIAVNLQLDNQFDRERVVQLTPVLLCAPTQKTCCAPGATAATPCQPIPCPADPSPNQPAPVDHFKCYKVKPTQCLSPTTVNDCATPGRFPKNVFEVTLTDQFHTEDVVVGLPQLLCTPVLKAVVRPTSTTTTSTTTTTICANPPCVPTTTTTTIPCRNTAAAGQPPMCAGDCPPQLACVFISSTGQCMCETPCALSGTACNQQFCPNAVQKCQPNATNPCGCCNFPGAPCSTGTDCCSGTCMATLTCQ